MTNPIIDEAIKRFDENMDHVFHGTEDGHFCWGDKTPIYTEEGTAPKQLVGYKTGQCFCGGEEKKKEVKAFLSSELLTAITQTRESVKKEIREHLKPSGHGDSYIISATRVKLLLPTTKQNEE